MNTLANLKQGDVVKAYFHKFASSDKRNSEDREKRSTNGQFDSMTGEVNAVKETSTGIQVIVRRTDGSPKPYGSLTSNQTFKSLIVNGVQVI
jgi:hypothetical protein